MRGRAAHINVVHEVDESYHRQKSHIEFTNKPPLRKDSPLGALVWHEVNIRLGARRMLVDLDCANYFFFGGERHDWDE